MAETVSCPSCGRASSVKRVSCMYCGAPLPVTESTLDVQVPVFRRLEEWERGFNVVLAPIDVGPPTEHMVDRLSEVTGLEPEVAQAVLEAKTPIPVARVATAQDAGVVARLLGAADLAASVVADDELAVERITRRVRALRFGDSALGVLVALGDWVEVPLEDIVACVEGRLVASRVEIVEATGRRSRRDLVEASEFYSEAFVFDLYGRTLDESYRIRAESFDFGCLEGKPAPFVEANVKRLAGELAAYLGPSRFDASFASVSKLLAHAWPAATRSTSQGLARKGDFRRYSVSAVDTDVLTQFTRYSRLRYALSRGRG
jgi:hypothetical protein